MDPGREAHGLTLIRLLAVLALAQLAFLLMLSLLLMSNRTRTWRRREEAKRASGAIAAPLQEWVSVGENPEPLRVALRALKPEAALEQLLLASGRIPPSKLEELSMSMRAEPWVEKVLHRSNSMMWWRRLEAARLMAIVGSDRDRSRLNELLRDEHPAVQAVASQALPRIADANAVDAVIDALPSQSVFVQLAQHSVLAQVWTLSVPALLERLVPAADPRALRSWISLAEAIGTPDLLQRVTTLRTHPDPQVRISVARAMKKYYHADALATLRMLLADPDARVRAKAAQSLGVTGAESAVPDLERALCDSNWWVRFRSALSLAQLGEQGRDVLRKARAQSDKYAADMATMISGLSPGGIVEMSEG